MASLFSIRGEQRFEVVRKIYEGGMGIVYEAEQEKHAARDAERLAVESNSELTQALLDLRGRNSDNSKYGNKC